MYLDYIDKALGLILIQLWSTEYGSLWLCLWKEKYSEKHRIKAFFLFLSFILQILQNTSFLCPLSVFSHYIMI